MEGCVCVDMVRAEDDGGAAGDLAPLYSRIALRATVFMSELEAPTP